MRPYLALALLLWGLHLGVVAVAALGLTPLLLCAAAFLAGACLGLGLSRLAQHLPLPRLLLLALLLNPSAWVAFYLLRPEYDPMHLGLAVAVAAFLLLLAGAFLLLLAALLPPWLAPWPLAFFGLLLAPLFQLLGDTLGQALPIPARWGALALGVALSGLGLRLAGTPAGTPPLASP
ncbi:hypothetical protein TJA_14800 [Thermus sp. LT1-2-5]|uniref:hypothetical protein n=1 Tax=Thermus sp. LT1-2-5 TaxID=3026935 RepID=UPI0030E968B9